MSAATDWTRVRRREAILRVLDAAEPNWRATEDVASAARCSRGEAVVELHWLWRAGHVEQGAPPQVQSRRPGYWRVVR
jgi:hypothetical protein